MTVQELVVRVSAEVKQAQMALREVQNELRKTGEAAKEASGEFDSFGTEAGAKVGAAKRSQEQFNRELDLTIGKVRELQGERLAFLDAKFRGLVAPEDLALLAEAQDYIKTTRIAQKEVSAEAVRSGAAQKAAIRETEAAQKAYNRELLLTKGRINEVATGQASLLSLRAKFGNLVSEKDLSELREVKNELSRIESEERKMRGAALEAKSAQEQFNRELQMTIAKKRQLEGDKTAVLSAKYNGLIAPEELARLAEAKEALLQLEAEQKALGESAEANAAAQRKAAAEAVAAQERYNTELRTTEERLREIRSGDANLSSLRSKFGGFVSDEDLSKLALAKKELGELEEAQRKFYTAMAAQDRELKANERSAFQKFGDKLSGNKMPGLRAEYNGISDEELAKLANKQTRIEGKKAGGELAASAGNGFANASAGVLGLGLAAAKNSADMETMFLKIKGNMVGATKDIHLTDDEFKKLKTDVLSLGADTGSSFDKLAEGMMHIYNLGFKGADSMRLLTVANQAAVATGSDVADTSQLLAKVMKENNIEVGKTSETMNSLWYAAGNSDEKLKDLIGTGGRAFAMASKLGVGFKETAAALSLLSVDLNPAQATTQFINVLNKIKSPTKEVQRELAELSKSGVNLSRDFTYTGLTTRQFSGVMDDVRAKAKELGIPVGELANDLFPNLRGTIGALIGTSDSGIKGLHTRLTDLGDLQSGKLNPIQKEFTDQQASTQAALDRLTNQIKKEFLPVGDEFAKTFKEAIPVIKDFVHIVDKGLELFLKLPKPLQDVVLGIGAIRLATYALGDPFPGMIKLISNMAAAWRGVKVAAGEAATAEEAAALAGQGGGGAVGGAAARTGVTGFLGSTAGAVAIGGMLLVGAQGAAGQGGDLPGGDPKANLANAEKQLAQAKTELTAWQKLTSDERLQYVESRYGANIWGAPIKGRDEEGTERLDKVEGLNRSIAYWKAAVEQQATAAAKAGGVVFRHGQDAAKVNQGLLKEIDAAGKALHMHIEVGTAITGHSKYTSGHKISRHGDGDAFDINRINGHAANVKDAAGAALTDQLVAFLKTKGFNFGEGQNDKAFLWRTKEHYNHLHVSQRSKDATGANDETVPGTGTGAANLKGQQYYDQMKAGLHGGGRKKSELEIEKTAYAKELAGAQAKLNEVMAGGDKIADNLAKKYHLLSAAERSRLASVNEQIAAKTKHGEVETKFREVLNQTNAAIREGRDGELEGLAKLQKAYPTISDASLKYLLKQKETAKSETEERELREKLTQGLSNYQAELGGTSGASEKHRLAIQLTGKDYDNLSAKVKTLIDNISQVKTKIEQSDAFGKVQEKFRQGMEKFQLMQMPKEQRDVVGAVGGVEEWKKLDPIQQALAGFYHKIGVGLQSTADNAEKAEAALEKFHAEMKGGIAASGAKSSGNKEETAWQEKLRGNEELSKALAKSGEAAKTARAEFHDFYEAQTGAEKITKANDALKKFNEELKESARVQGQRKTGEKETAASAFSSLLGKDENLKNAASNPIAALMMFAQFKANFDMTRQNDQLDKTRQSLANVRKEMLLLTASSDFDKFKSGLLEMDKSGNLNQPFDASQLDAMFKAQQQLQQAQQWQSGLQGITNNAVGSLFKSPTADVGLLDRQASEQRGLYQLNSDYQTQMKGRLGDDPMVGQITQQYNAEKQRLTTQLADTERQVNQHKNTVANIFKNLFNTVEQGFESMLAKMAENYLASQAWNLIAKSLGGLGAAGGGGGGLNVLGGVFDGGDGIVAGARASGGPVMGGRAYLVGEKGPEIMVPGGSGTIIPNDALTSGSNGGGDIHIHMNITTPDANSFRQSSGQLLSDAQRHSQTAFQRNR